MAAIDYGSGPNTNTGDLMPAAVGKLRDRLAARGFDPGNLGSDIASALAKIETALQLAEANYTPGTQLRLLLSGTPLSAAAGIPYSFTPTVSYAEGTVTFSLTGALPTGLSFDNATGTISGTPSASGNVNVTIGAVDSKYSALLSVAITIGSGQVTPPVSTALTATPSTATVSAGVTAGTLIANIGNVPAGVTPTVSPNDGRFAIAGDATAGWKVVTGLSALSAGAVSVAVNATGANPVTIPVTVTAVGQPSTLPALTEAFIATNQIMAVSAGTIPAGKERFIDRSRHYIDSFTGANSIRVSILPWHSVNETADGALTIDSMKLVVGGVVTDLLAGVGTLIVNGTEAMARGPLIPVSIPANATISIWIEGTGAAGQKVAVGPQFATAGNNAVPTGGSFNYYPAADQVTQDYASDTVTVPANAQSGGNFGIAICITGEQANKAVPSVFVHGDSIIAFGLGNAALGWDTTTARRGGFVAAQSDTNLSDYVAHPEKRKELMKFANVYVQEPGTNDLRDLRTATQLAADALVAINDFKSATPGGKTVRTLLFPRCDNPKITAVSSSGTLVTATTPSTVGLVTGNNYGLLNMPTGYGAALASPVPITVISATQFTYSVASAPADAAPSVIPAARISDQQVGRGMQRPIVGFGPGESRDQFHTTVQTWLSNGTIDAIADVMTPSAASDDTHYWLTDSPTSGIGTGTSNLRTVDWVHESTANRTITKEVIKTAINNVASGAGAGAGGGTSTPPANPGDTTAPTITSASTGSVAEGTAYSITLTANETVTWTKRTGADSALFTLSGSTLTLATKDFEAPTDSDANNTYICNLTATDSAGNTTNFTHTVSVTDVVEAPPPTSTPFFVETFTAADGTLLTGKQADTGGTWSRNGAYAVDYSIANNRAYCTQNAVAAENSVVPPSANYEVTGEFFTPTVAAVSGRRSYVTFRGDTAALNAYGIGRNEGAGGNAVWHLVKLVNGVVTQLLAAPVSALAAGETHTVRARVEGSTITFYLDGALIGTATDATYAAAGAIGIAQLNGSTGTATSTSVTTITASAL